MDESVAAGRILNAVLWSDWKGRQNVLTSPAGHNEERPIIPQLQCERCHRNGTGQATLKVIGTKRSYYTLKCCKVNNPDDELINWCYLLPASLCPSAQWPCQTPASRHVESFQCHHRPPPHQGLPLYMSCQIPSDRMQICTRCSHPVHSVAIYTNSVENGGLVAISNSGRLSHW